MVSRPGNGNTIFNCVTQPAVWGEGSFGSR
jgi:hypothetical protein